MPIAVLGAGMQGTCIALELARRGFDVDLLDQDFEPLNRASLRNEGKIHLGFVYARDATLRTARLMIEGALAYRRLLSDWTAGALDHPVLSEPFTYLVPEDSALPPAKLAAHYAAVERLYEDGVRAGGDYLGLAPDRLWRPLDRGDYSAFAAAEHVQAGFATAEVSVDLRETAAVLRRVLSAHSRIRLLLGKRVRQVVRTRAGFRVEGDAAEAEHWSLDCDQVVNALWDGRLNIDRGLGLLPTRPWVHRLKYRVMVARPDRLRRMPSLSFVLGPYGDVAAYPGGEAYVSWYPECLRGWSTEVEPPVDWAAACTGRLPPGEQLAIGRRVLDAFDRLVPGLAGADVRTVDAGVIFSWGQTDITDPASVLHRRDETGVESADGYHSVNTGKLTTAPLFAVDAADRVAGRVVAPRSS
ncbi:MAG TPA: FAD-dependent oxidoreductase [Pseudomonadales bacterium]|nr:FAD-dependent oxidoreductase [Pseudomonadales bacterium]